MADHAQVSVSDTVRPGGVRCRTGGCCSPTTRIADGAELAVCPGARSAMVYRDRDRGGRARARLAAVLERLAEHRGRGVCLAWKDGEALRVDRRAASCGSRPGAAVRDRRGMAGTSRDGLAALEPEIAVDEIADSRTYPDALRRLWAALECAGAGRRAGLGGARATSSSTGAAPTTSAGGSHGSLRRGDSLGAARVRELRPGCWTPAPSGRRHWSITDVAQVVLDPLRCMRA